MEVLPLLQEAGLASDEVVRWLQAELVETADDLAHCFRSAEAVRTQAPHMVDAWLLASRYQTEAWRGIAGVIQLVRETRQAAMFIAEAVRPTVAPKRQRHAARQRRATGKPRVQPLAMSRAKDQVARTKAAAAATVLSLRWAPQAGIAQGLEPGDPLLAMVREVYEARLSLFEPKGLWAVINNWNAWADHHAKYAKTDSTPEARILLDTYIHSKTTATGPLAAWNQFEFARRHLKASLPISDIPKPPKGGGEDGIVKQSVQAVAMPPEYLMAYETCLENMVLASDWRRVPLAVALTVAYSLVRIVHMGRSTFKHVGDLVLWLEAYRGKGKREGARKSFLWAMVRHGITDFDIGEVIYSAWRMWSEKRGAPLDYIVLDPETGTQMQSAHVQAVMRSVAETFVPDPAQRRLIQPYSNRRFGGTLASITETPPKDIVDYGGWAGVPELAKVMTDATPALNAWKRSMPHRYNDRRNENEELQKLLHIQMIRDLIANVPTWDPDNESWVHAPATWDTIAATAARLGEDGVRILTSVRLEAMDTVSKQIRGSTSSSAYGADTPMRRQFQVTLVPVAKRPRLRPPATLTVPLDKRASAKVPGPPSREKCTEVKREGGLPAGASDAAATATDMSTREWLMTDRSKYLHCVEMRGELIFTACKWRKGEAARKPVQPERVLWRGNRDEALSMSIDFCPDRACRP